MNDIPHFDFRANSVSGTTTCRRFATHPAAPHRDGGCGRCWDLGRHLGQLGHLGHLNWFVYIYYIHSRTTWLKHGHYMVILLGGFDIFQPWSFCVPLWDDPSSQLFSGELWRHWLTVSPLNILVTYHCYHGLALNMMELYGTSIWDQYTARPALWQVSICLDIAKLTSDVLLWPGVSSELMEVMVLVLYGAAECSTDSSVLTQVKYRHAHPAGNYKRAPHSSLTLLASST